jgi:hypothetical protein
MNPAGAPTEIAEDVRLREAIGRNAQYYLPRWQAMEDKGKKTSWNWPACLLNLYWFAWRKMWGWFALLLLVLILLGIAGAAGPRAGQLSFLASIGVSFITGAYGNHLYRRHCERRVAATNGMAPDQARAYLAKRGGTSALALTILLAFTLALSALAVAGMRAAQQDRDVAGEARAQACPSVEERRWLA